MRNLTPNEIEEYADRVRTSLKDLTPIEKQQVFHKLEHNSRSQEDGFFDDVNFDVNIDDLE